MYCYLSRLLDRLAAENVHIRREPVAPVLSHTQQRCVPVRDYSGLFISALFAEVALWELPRCHQVNTVALEPYTIARKSDLH